MTCQFLTNVENPFFVEKVAIMNRKWENLNYTWQCN